MRRSGKKEEAEIQTVLICSPHIISEGDEANVQSNQLVQTVASAPPFVRDEDFYEQLQRADVFEIREDCVRILPYRRIRRIQFSLPDEEPEESSPVISIETVEVETEPERAEQVSTSYIDLLHQTQQTQTILRVFPHYLHPRERAAVLCDCNTQTEVTCEPATSINEIIPKLRTYLEHTGTEIYAGQGGKASIVQLIQGIIDNIDQTREELFDDADYDSLTADSSYCLVSVPKKQKVTKHEDVGKSRSEPCNMCEKQNIILLRQLQDLSARCTNFCKYPEVKCIFQDVSSGTLFDQCVPCSGDETSNILKLIENICQKEVKPIPVNIRTAWGDSTQILQQYEAQTIINNKPDGHFNAEIINNDFILMVAQNGDRIFVETKTNYSLSSNKIETKTETQQILEAGDRCCRLPSGSEDCQTCLCNGVKINLCIKNFGSTPAEDPNKIVLDLNLLPGFEKLEVKEFNKEPKEDCMEECPKKTNEGSETKHVCPAIMKRVETGDNIQFVEDDGTDCCNDMSDSKEKDTCIKKNKGTDSQDCRAMSICNLLGGTIMTLVSKSKEGFDVVINLNNPTLQDTDNKKCPSKNCTCSSSPVSSPISNKRCSCSTKNCKCSSITSPISDKRCPCPSENCNCSPVTSPVSNKRCPCPSENCNCSPVTSPVSNKRCPCPSEKCNCSPVTSPVSNKRCPCPSETCNCSPVMSPISNKRSFPTSPTSNSNRCSPETKSLKSDSPSVCATPVKKIRTVTKLKRPSTCTTCTAKVIASTKPKSCTSKIDNTPIVCSDIQKSQSSPGGLSCTPCLSSTTVSPKPKSPLERYGFISKSCCTDEIQKNVSFNKQKLCCQGKVNCMEPPKIKCTKNEPVGPETCIEKSPGETICKTVASKLCLPSRILPPGFITGQIRIRTGGVNKKTQVTPKPNCDCKSDCDINSKKSNKKAISSSETCQTIKSETPNFKYHSEPQILKEKNPEDEWKTLENQNTFEQKHEESFEIIPSHAISHENSFLLTPVSPRKIRISDEPTITEISLPSTSPPVFSGIPSAHTSFQLPNNTVLNVRLTLDMKQEQQQLEETDSKDSIQTIAESHRTKKTHDIHNLNHIPSTPSVGYLKELNPLYTNSSRTLHIYPTNSHSWSDDKSKRMISFNADVNYLDEDENSTKSVPNLCENRSQIVDKSSSKSLKWCTKDPENKDVVFMAFKTCEEELKPAFNALKNIKQELQMLNMPEIDCIFREPETDVHTKRLENSSSKIKITITAKESTLSQKLKTNTKVKINYLKPTETQTETCCLKPKFEVINSPSQPKLYFSDSGRSTPKIYSTTKIKISDKKRKHYTPSTCSSKSSHYYPKHTSTKFPKQSNYPYFSIKICDSKVKPSSSSSQRTQSKPKFDSAYCSYPTTSGTFPTQSKQTVAESFCSNSNKKPEKKSSANSLSVHASTSEHSICSRVSSHVSSEAFVCPARHKIRKKSKRRKPNRCSCTSVECPFFEAFVRTIRRISDLERDRR